jgi:DNA-binding ferritin-like protein (Dps family)
MMMLGYTSVLKDLSRAQTKLLNSRLSLFKVTKGKEKEVWEVAIEDASATVEKLVRKMKEFE